MRVYTCVMRLEVRCYKVEYKDPMDMSRLQLFIHQTICLLSVMLRSSPVTPAAPASTELAICLSRARSSPVESSETLCLLISFSR